MNQSDPDWQTVRLKQALQDLALMQQLFRFQNPP